jgi:hypothetical protein
VERSPIPSVKRACSVCGAKVWIDKKLPGELERIYPDKTVTPVCMRCEVTGEQESLSAPVSQVARLLQSGLPAAMVAHALAVGEVCGGKGSLEETEEEILAFPDGLKAKQYQEALKTTVAAVAGVLRRN